MKGLSKRLGIPSVDFMQLKRDIINILKVFPLWMWIVGLIALILYQIYR